MRQQAADPVQALHPAGEQQQQVVLAHDLHQEEMDMWPAQVVHLRTVCVRCKLPVGSGSAGVHTSCVPFLQSTVKQQDTDPDV